jgi:hypothetical protein
MQQQQRYLNSYPQTQVLQSGPGVLPPPQSLASLSTPGSGATWHAGYVSREGRDYSHRGGPGRGIPQQGGRGSSGGRGYQNNPNPTTPQKISPRGPPAVPIAPTLSSPIDLRPSSGSSPVPPPFSGSHQPILVTPNASQPRQSQRQFGRNLPTGTLMNPSDVKSVASPPATTPVPSIPPSAPPSNPISCH